jgi:phage shock protein E
MPRFRNTPVDLVIDVRSRLEYWLGHAPGAVCIPVHRLAGEIGRHPVTPESRILVYCASGARSSTAADILRQMGFKRVTNGGGVAEVRQALSE